MASALSISGVLERLEEDDLGISDGEDSDFEGDEIHCYLPGNSLGPIPEKEDREATDHFNHEEDGEDIMTGCQSWF